MKIQKSQRALGRSRIRIVVLSCLIVLSYRIFCIVYAGEQHVRIGSGLTMAILHETLGFLDRNLLSKTAMELMRKLCNSDSRSGNLSPHNISSLRSLREEPKKRGVQLHSEAEYHQLPFHDFS